MALAAIHARKSTDDQPERTIPRVLIGGHPDATSQRSTLVVSSRRGGDDPGNGGRRQVTMGQRYVLVPLLAVVAIVLATVPAWAACRWVWDCSRQPCSQIELCDKTTDPPAIRPTEVPPIPRTTLVPLPTPMNPPTGTHQCQQANICNSAGECKWETVCR